MSETKFTPGPWRVAFTALDAEVLAGNRKRCVACISRDSSDDDANVALIAASPDLYAALEERNALVLRAQSIIARFHGGLLTAREFEHEMTGLFTGSDVDTSAHAALAKARGEP